MLKESCECAASSNLAWGLLRRSFPTLQVLVLAIAHDVFPVCAWSRNTEVHLPESLSTTMDMAAAELRFLGDALAR